MAEATEINLADEPPLVLGGARIDPPSRTLEANGRSAILEPRTMQVLVMLARRPDQVVGRQTLIDACWGGRIVGEDAINRAILKLRRAIEEVSDAITIMTVSRVGYRLSVDRAIAAPEEDGAPISRYNRRGLLLAGGATVVAIGGASVVLWPRLRNGAQRSQAAQQLYERGEAAFQQGSRDDNAQAVGFFERAAAIAPRDARIAGALALAYRFEQTFLGPKVIKWSTARADRATALALALDPRDPDAVAAHSMYVPFGNHWLETEQLLRAGLRIVPSSGVMNGFLGMVLAAVGRTAEAITAFEHGLQDAAFVPLLRGFYADALFAAGRIGDADRALDNAATLWPRFANLWWLRFWTFALTGRYAQARQHITGGNNTPVEIGPGQIDAANAALVALETRSVSAIDHALAAWQRIAAHDHRALQMVIGLAASLGRPDYAFTQLAVYFAPLMPGGAGRSASTTFLFSAPLASLRDDPRFWTLCDEIGLSAYWRRTRSHPDVRKS